MGFITDFFFFGFLGTVEYMVEELRGVLLLS